ncbi:protein of unknown function (plasmid) [Azospirillum lipoferum 4B]|uniref:Uncharacterized protein n=1 Tax=Azospirillum lipoferum (strain 4B) TaxID=862719 RepID=G7ZB49_AZOL4|nr:protein of unknown function [Azospirillum lipoferum 4B]
MDHLLNELPHLCFDARTQGVYRSYVYTNEFVDLLPYEFDALHEGSHDSETILSTDIRFNVRYALAFIHRSSLHHLESTGMEERPAPYPEHAVYENPPPQGGMGRRPPISKGGNAHQRAILGPVIQFRTSTALGVAPNGVRRAVPAVSCQTTSGDGGDSPTCCTVNRHGGNPDSAVVKTFIYARVPQRKNE